MILFQNHSRQRAIIPIGFSRHWSVVNRSMLAILALCSGDATISHQAGQPPDAPGTVNHGDTNTVAGNQAPVTDPKTRFQEKATDRQRFQVHIDFGKVFETQGNLDAAILEYQDALAVVQSKRRGTLRPG